MPNTTITLEVNPTQAAFVQRLVAENGYASAAEVAREALDLMREKDRAMDKWLREEVLPVYERIKSGEERAIPAEEVFARLRARRAAKRRESGHRRAG